MKTEIGNLKYSQLIKSKVLCIISIIYRQYLRENVKIKPKNI